MRQFPKVSPRFNEQYFYYNQLPIDKTVSFRLPAQLAKDFNHCVELMGSKSSDELRNFMIDYISFVYGRADVLRQNEQRATL